MSAPGTGRKGTAENGARSARCLYGATLGDGAAWLRCPRRHSSRPWAGRSADIRTECSAVYTLRCLYMARIMSRDTFRIAWILPSRPTVTPL